MGRVPRLPGPVRRVHPRRVDGDVRARGEPQARPRADQGARAVGRSRGRRGSRGPAIFSPTCSCATSYARISFRLGKPGPLVAWIVSPTGTVVRRIGDFENVRRVTLIWSGRDQRGRASARRQLPPAAQGRRGDEDAARVRRRPHASPCASAPPSRRGRLTLNGDGVDDHAVITWHSPVQLFNVRLKARNGDDADDHAVYRHSRSYSFQWPRATCRRERLPRRAAPGAGRVDARNCSPRTSPATSRSSPSARVQVANR